MNPLQPRAEAIAVRDGKFIAIGSQAEVARLAGSSARIDKTFAGKVKPTTLPALKPQAAASDLQQESTQTLVALVSHKHDH
ncbi:hypothetical protein HQ393_03820 [Chitinibacter bivalviorum]|uniref:Uncharacterized protein n=1 Tax=Chitinibacter bivalviorum TaxID=2739434 RepID=A0A7H9BFP3_9NEIS|nr:hypothetical protein [Chitinibacter bivalviorum]QLG87449.1 hypothetical protein HQ393_03820 [Chitinibacter bivalviorum]